MSEMKLVPADRKSFMVAWKATNKSGHQIIFLFILVIVDFSCWRAYASLSSAEITSI